MYRITNVWAGKSWNIIFSLQLLLCSPLLSNEKNINPRLEGWANHLEKSPIEIPLQVKHLDELTELAISRNSEIRAQYAEWKANQEAGNTISSLPDPTLGIGYFIEPVETAQGPQSLKISLGQTIPWFSKIKASREKSEY